MATIDESILVSIPVCVIVVEAALALPLVSWIKKLMIIGRKSARLLRSSQISDHWKERILPVYAMTMLKASLLIFVLIIFLFSIFTLGLHLGAWMFTNEFEWLSVLQRADYMLSSFLIALSYIAARRFVRDV